MRKLPLLSASQQWQAGRCASIPASTFQEPRKDLECLQRLLTGAARGIECFDVSRPFGLVAYAEKVWLVTPGFVAVIRTESFELHFICQQGIAPLLHIHSTSDLTLLQTINWSTEAGYQDLAFSGDGKYLAATEQERNSRLAVWDWQTVTAPDLALSSTHQGA